MRRPDNEPLLFDLPLDRPPRDDDAEPQSDREPSSGGAGGAAGRPGRAPRQQPGGGRRPEPAAPGTRRAPEAVQPEIAGLAPSAASRAPKPAPPGSGRAASPAGIGASAPAGWFEEDAGEEPPPAAAAPGEARAGIGRRIAAGAADLLVHLAVGVLALAGCRYLGVFPEVSDWPAGMVFLLSFSFLYTVVPLAFWGHTLGMTWAGLSSQSSDGEPLSFDQTARRWLGMLLTLATLGLPLLFAFGGRSLTDRLSDSRTLPSS